MAVDGINLEIVIHPVPHRSQSISIFGFIRWSPTDTEHFVGKLRLDLPFCPIRGLQDCTACSNAAKPVIPLKEFTNLNADLFDLKYSAITLEDRVGVFICKNVHCRRIYLMIVSTEHPDRQLRLSNKVPKNLILRLPRHLQDGHDGTENLDLRFLWNTNDSRPATCQFNFL